MQQMRQQFGGRGGRGGRAGAAGDGPAPIPGAPTVPFARPGAAAQFSEEQRAGAQLPKPLQQGSDVDILLRPGLLADAEIIVENLPNVLHIPYQAVFAVAGNPVVYAWNGGRFEPRRVQLGQRSEARIVILDGLEEGEIIALESPDAAAERDRAKKKKKAAGEGQPALPGMGGGPGGGGPGRSR